MPVQGIITESTFHSEKYVPTFSRCHPKSVYFCNYLLFLYVLVDVDEMGVVLGVDVVTGEIGAEG